MDRKQPFLTQEVLISQLQVGNNDANTLISSEAGVSSKNIHEYAILYGGDDDVFIPEDT